MSTALSLEVQRGLDEARLAALRAARAVGLARHHTSPVELKIEGGVHGAQLVIQFDAPGDRSLAAWDDRDQTTEWAAEAIALEAIHATRGWGTVRRAARGTRFDWYVGPPDADLETAWALEVGGTDRGRAEAVLAKKLRQLRMRATGLPGVAVAVQLSSPRAMMRDA